MNVLLQPMLKLVDRVRADSRVRRIHDRAQTPYQPLCAAGLLEPEQGEAPAEQYRRLNSSR